MPPRAAAGEKRVPGFYIAHHRWLDAENGAGALHKVGHSGDLRRRLRDDAYVTCFPPGWAFVATIETRTKKDAQRLEAGVLHCAAAHRLSRASGAQSELVRLGAAELEQLAREVAATLGVAGETRAAPAYPAPAPAARAAGVPAADGDADAESVLDPNELALLAPLARARLDAPADARAAAGAACEDAAGEGAAGAAGAACEDAAGEGAAGADAAPEEEAVAGADALEGAEGAAGADALEGVAGATEGAADDAMADELERLLEPGGGDLAEILAGGAAEGGGPLEDRAYQAEAAAAALRELAAGGRTIVRMACRCGKTRVAHDVVRDYFERPRGGGRPAALFLVPGLALLRQTARKLDRYGGLRADLLLVGSDRRPLEGLANLRLAAPAGTTDAAEIAGVAAAGGKRPLLVVSTYQSSEALPDAFDLVVFDESHRVCGDDARPRPFTRVLLGFERGDRLYMTATPRYDARLSMKDRGLFGSVAYAYHLRAGIDAGYVNDFSLELVGRPAAAGEDGRLATAAQVAAAHAQLGGDGKLLVFCQNVRHAEALRAETEAALAANATAGGPAPETFAAHSRMAPARVAEALRRFCEPGRAAILFNCRLFQEGVEIPALNGVFFAAPRHSPRDIIQSLCRPLNALPGKPPSKVFVPVAVDPAAPPDAPANLDRFASIVPYADALIAEDPALFTHLLDPAGAPYALGWVDSAAGAIRYRPAVLLAAARRAVRRNGAGATERLLRAANIPWEIGFGELRRIVEACRRYPKTTDCFVYGEGEVNFGHFYHYVREAYARWRAGEPQPLEAFQIRALEGLEKWAPFGAEGPYPWAYCLAFFERWLEEHAGDPPMVEINTGGFVGLDATDMERLSGVFTCVNQGDGRDRKSGGAPRPGSGFTLDAAKQADLDRVCARWGLRWRKDRLPAPPGCAAGSLVEDAKGRYTGRPTFIQEAHARFKTEWSRVLTARNGGADDAAMGPYFARWFPGYPQKHRQQEHSDVWARRKEIVPPRKKKAPPARRPRAPAAKAADGGG
jgi:superfamily II DNA or RNA helicase